MIARLIGLAKKHKGTAIIVALVAILGALIFVDRVLSTLSKVNDVVASLVSMGVNSAGNPVIIHAWFSWGIIFLMLFVAIALGALVVSRSRAISEIESLTGEAQTLTGRVEELRVQFERLQKEKEGVIAGRLKKEELVRKTFNRMTTAAYRITRQTATGTPKKQIVEVDNTYLISSNYDGEVTRKYKLRAVEPLHFWEIRIGAESEATPMELPDEIDLKITDDQGHGIVYLPTENGLHLKVVAVFFLPPLQPDQETTVVVKFRWPGLFNKLKQDGFELAEWNLAGQSTNNIEKACFSFCVDPALGKKLSCEIEGAQAAKQGVEACTDPVNGWPGKAYKIEDAPAALYALRVELK